MSEVEEVFSYLCEHPTAADILMLVHEVTTKKPLSGNVDQDSFEREFSELPQLMGTMERPPDGFSENFQFAEDMMKQMRQGSNA